MLLLSCLQRIADPRSRHQREYFLCGLLAVFMNFWHYLSLAPAPLSLATASEGKGTYPLLGKCSPSPRASVGEGPGDEGESA
jgi:threonine/homoserine efflux transporter RhtA